MWGMTKLNDSSTTFDVLMFIQLNTLRANGITGEGLNAYQLSILIWNTEAEGTYGAN